MASRGEFLDYLDDRDEALACALAMGMNDKEASHAVNVSLKTVWRRRQDQGFMRRVGLIRRIFRESAASRLIGIMEVAIDEAATLLQDPDPKVRIAAVKTILASGLRFSLVTDPVQETEAGKDTADAYEERLRELGIG